VTDVVNVGINVIAKEVPRMSRNPFSNVRLPSRTTPGQRLSPWQRPLSLLGAAAVCLLSVAMLAAVGAPAAVGATPTVNLGTASPFAVLAGSTITNTGSSVISGNIGLSPGTSITGFPPGVQSSGVTDKTDATALSAEGAATSAYLDAAGRTPFSVAPSDLGGSTLAAGVYESASSMSLTGTLTLNGGGDADAVFIFQAGSTLTTASGSDVVLENGAQACNVFWQVGSSATVGTTSDFAGTILALSSATLDTGATVRGRVLARNGAVTLDDNTISVPTCLAAPATTTTTAAKSTTTTTAAKSTTTTTTAKSSTSTTIKSTGKPTTTTTVKKKSVPKHTASVTTTTGSVIPRGAPQTGLGDSTGSGPTPRSLLGFGAIALAGFAATMAANARRRRVSSDRNPSHGPRDS